MERPHTLQRVKEEDKVMRVPSVENKIAERTKFVYGFKQEKLISRAAGAISKGQAHKFPRLLLTIFLTKMAAQYTASES
ncbi:hypothetical protein E2C01_043964 [Portunus trituberculatus]|uniref:Uncharacterized protein n=1 Tax=Portunus trituberculatus TaxID=210409 RepID=A0A5B7FUB2_PORTR|nr:hypothetical protein [Portunus trituberculatus]